MNIAILTIFPEIFESFLRTSLIKSAIDAKIVNISTVQIRDFASPAHYKVDDSPYGGGAGMVFKPEPLAGAILHAKNLLPNAKIILLSPSGKLYNQQSATELSQEQNLILICGRYEGIDQRIIDLYVDQEISIGDYILMGGEVPAMSIIESVTRLLPGVLGNSESSQNESFSEAPDLVEAPHYTRPASFNGLEVPAVLLSGDHAAIKAWKKAEGLLKSKKRSL